MVTMYAQIEESQVTEYPCLTDPDLFFAESPADIARAKELCRGCPAAAACLAGALDRAEPWGVWGGELVLRGAVIASKRGRGRPRGSSARHPGGSDARLPGEFSLRHPTRDLPRVPRPDRGTAARAVRTSPASRARRPLT